MEARGESYPNISEPRFTRYELLEVLGRGGFATVYRAKDRNLVREVALKVLRPRIAQDPDASNRFLNEAGRIAQLRHPNIVKVHDIGEENGVPFFTMEVVEGETLAQLVPPGGTLPIERVVHLLTELAKAVDCLHFSRVVHRDIKAANVMLESSGRVVLMDFGIALTLDATINTRTGVVIGTPEAMAPEQILGHDVGAAADIYALGILAYRLLCGAPPFTGEATRVMFAHVYDQPPPLRERRPDLPESTYQAIDAALAKRPSDRPVSAAAFVAALGTSDTIRTRPARFFVEHLTPTLLQPPATLASACVPETANVESATPTGRLQPISKGALPIQARETGRRRWRLARCIVGGTLAGLLVTIGAFGVAVTKSGSSGSDSTVANPPAASISMETSTDTAFALPATSTPSARSSPSPSSTPSRTPTLSPKSASDVADKDLVRAGATAVQRGVIAGTGGDPGTIALYSQAPPGSGCAQPYVDLLRRNETGRWVRVWEATSMPAGSPLLQPVHRNAAGTCSPAVKQFAVRPLADGQEARVVLSVSDSDESQRIVVLSWDAARNQVTMLSDLHTTPVAWTNLGDGQPATIGLVENGYPPASSGLTPSYDRPTGRLSMLLTWHENGFEASGQTFAPSCSQGQLARKATNDDGSAIMLRCADGLSNANSAFAVTPDTVFLAGSGFEDLQEGDTVSVTLLDSSPAIADPLRALPIAATVDSPTARSRREAEATPTPAPRPATTPPSRPAPPPPAPPKQDPTPRPAPPAPPPPPPPSPSPAPATQPPTQQPKPPYQLPTLPPLPKGIPTLPAQFPPRPVP